LNFYFYFLAFFLAVFGTKISKKLAKNPPNHEPPAPPLAAHYGKPWGSQKNNHCFFFSLKKNTRVFFFPEKKSCGISCRKFLGLRKKRTDFFSQKK
jgi:hypothetical protein